MTERERESVRAGAKLSGKGGPILRFPRRKWERYAENYTQTEPARYRKRLCAWRASGIRQIHPKNRI